VVVDDFDTVGTSCRPDKADALLPIDADAGWLLGISAPQTS
jgi:hypothetical protein